MRKFVVAVSFLAGFMACRTAAADETTLIFTDIALPNTPAAGMYHEWADKVNAAGKGIVHLDIRDGFTLVSSSNFYDRLLNDVVQVTFGSTNYLGGQFRLSQIMALPFLFESSEEASAVFWRLYQAGLMGAEFDKVIPLALQGFPQESPHLIKAPTAPLNDLKGLRMIAGGQTMTRVATLLGATPISVPLTDSYEALQRGTADGMFFPMAAIHDFKIDEVTHYHPMAPLGGGPGGIWMSKAKFQSLPTAVQKILTDNSGEAASKRLGHLLDQLQGEEPKHLNTLADQKVVSLTAEQHGLWQKAVQPIFSSWDEQDKNQAETVLAKAREFAAAVKAGH
ncbi:MAG TPA: TRAP transporter substrate-binding protein DctP [Stellaceae bacterium]|jgi:TRAP-type C4-dicarboxylate transport system substrate-binding protein|nr:TRAP transporter substrate-binding protein DctP [Stellaceae bacterium]